MEKEDKSIIRSTIFMGVILFLIGIVFGCFVMYVSHRDIYHHVNSCQESALLETIAELKTEKTWYIKEDSYGKLKVIELSKQELDSLSNK